MESEPYPHMVVGRKLDHQCNPQNDIRKSLIWATLCFLPSSKTFAARTGVHVKRIMTHRDWELHNALLYSPTEKVTQLYLVYFFFCYALGTIPGVGAVAYNVRSLESNKTTIRRPSMEKCANRRHLVHEHLDKPPERTAAITYRSVRLEVTSLKGNLRRAERYSPKRPDI
jgi:hypothetical protein